MSGEKLVNLIGSFMKGKRDAEDRKLKTEMDKENLATVREQRKAQTKLAELKGRELEYKQKLIDTLLQTGGMNFGQPPQAAPVQQPGALDLMANPELINIHRSDTPAASPAQTPQNQGPDFDNMNPLHAVLYSEMTGLPIMDVMKFNETKRNNQRLERQGDVRIGMTAQNNAFNQGLAGMETIQVPVTDAAGATFVNRIPKYPGLAGGGRQPSPNSRPSGPGGIQTSPASMDKLLSDEDRILWVDPKTMRAAPLGSTPKSATNNGYVRITPASKEKSRSYTLALDNMLKIGDMMKKVFPYTEDKATGEIKGKGGAGERITGAPSRWLGAKLQTNPEAARLQRKIRGTIASVARMIGEVGNLAEQEQARALEMQAQLIDSPEVAWGVYNDLLELTQNSKMRFLGEVMQDGGLPNAQTGSGGGKKPDYKYVPGKGLVAVQ
jgi:hypothetical protein